MQHGKSTLSDVEFPFGIECVGALLERFFEPRWDSAAPRATPRRPKFASIPPTQPPSGHYSRARLRYLLNRVCIGPQFTVGTE